MNDNGIDVPYRDPLWQDCFHLRLKRRDGLEVEDTYCDDDANHQELDTKLRISTEL